MRMDEIVNEHAESRNTTDGTSNLDSFRQGIEFAAQKIDSAKDSIMQLPSLVLDGIKSGCVSAESFLGIHGDEAKAIKAPGAKIELPQDPPFEVLQQNIGGSPTKVRVKDFEKTYDMKYEDPTRRLTEIASTDSEFKASISYNEKTGQQTVKAYDEHDKLQSTTVNSFDSNSKITKEEFADSKGEKITSNFNADGKVGSQQIVGPDGRRDDLSFKYGAGKDAAISVERTSRDASGNVQKISDEKRSPWQRTPGAEVMILQPSAG